MRLQLYAAPTTEPLTLTEVKTHLRLDTSSWADAVSEAYSIVPASYSAGTVTGAGVDVSNTQALAILVSGANVATGTVNVRLQESDDNLTFTDVASGAFTQVTTANDEAIQELSYSGVKQYIRAVAVVANAACVFGVTIVRDAQATAEDAYLSALITISRLNAEVTTRRALITQTWDYYIDGFPGIRKLVPIPSMMWLPFGDIEIPKPPLQSITSIAYTDSHGTAYPMTPTTDYLIDTVSEPGRLVTPYGVPWPMAMLYPLNPVKIRFICGYGAAAAVPPPIKQAMLIDISDMYENRESIAQGVFAHLPVVDRLMAPYRVWTF